MTTTSSTDIKFMLLLILYTWKKKEIADRAWDYTVNVSVGSLVNSLFSHPLSTGMYMYVPGERYTKLTRTTTTTNE